MTTSTYKGDPAYFATAEMIPILFAGFKVRHSPTVVIAPNGEHWNVRRFRSEFLGWRFALDLDNHLVTNSAWVALTRSYFYRPN